MKILFSSYSLSPSNINFKSNSSALKLSTGSNFVVSNSITTTKGKIIKDSGSNVSGGNISFDDGVLEESGNKINISGALDLGSENKIRLNGNGLFRGKKGTLLQAIYISGLNNRLEGEILVSDDITLQDVNTSVTAGLLGKLACNICLNNGSLYLTEDLNFIDQKKVVGPGKIILNKRKICFGAQDFRCTDSLYFENASDVELNSNMHMNSRWTFSGGENIFNGNGNIVYLETGGQIIIERGSSILLKNVTMHKLSGEFCCLDNLGTVSFQDVKVILDHDCTFSKGRFNVLNKLSFAGAYKWIYQSEKQSKILSKAKIVLDQGITFSYDPLVARKDLIYMEDSTSILHLINSTIHSTSTGIQLTKGTLEIEGNCYLSSEASYQAEGIAFGDGLIESNNLSIDVLRESSLKLLSGYLVYDNVN